MVSILEPNTLSLTVNTSSVTCFGGNDGEIEIFANGGTEGYQYSINDGLNYQSSPVFSYLIAGDYQIRVQDANSCEAASIESLTEPTGLPSVSFSGLGSDYCSYDEPITLVGNHAPLGVFVGNGIFDNGDGTAEFNPIDAGDGNHTIIYHFTSAEGCYNEEQQITNISLPTAISIEGLSEQYCLNSGEILITGSQAPEGLFSGIGVDDNGDGTAWFKTAVAGLGGPFSISYQYENEEGCLSEIVLNTEILPDPFAFQAGLDSIYCVDAGEVIITSNNPTGTFSGPGIIDNNNGTAIFTPSLAGVGGPYQIRYEIINNIGCVAVDLKEVTISGYLDISFANLEESYCSNSSCIQITGSEVPYGNFIGPGITDNNNGTAEFNPSAVNAGGPYELTYYYAEEGGCTSEYHQEVMIGEVEEISFSGLASSYCFGEGQQQLVGSHAPYGYFEGQGIEEQSEGIASFNPDLIIPGQEDTVSYFYENDNLCLSSVSLISLVKENPVADFEFVVYQCNDEVVFMDQSYSSNGDIVSWDWNFGDVYSGGFNVSDIQNPVHDFVTNYSSFDIHLAIEDQSGCHADTLKTIIPYSGVSISGNVSKTDGEPIQEGYVAAFYLSDGVLSIFADLTPIQENGDYEFVGMSSCVDYLIHAIPKRQVYPYVFPRWYDDAFYWTDAEVVSATFSSEQITGIDFVLQEQSPLPQGSSSISGGVYYLNSKGEPVKNVDIVLEFDDPMDKNMGVSEYEFSGSDGQWIFDQIPNGSYKVKVDIPGLRMDSVYHIQISELETHISNLNYYVDTLSGIYIIISGIEDVNQQAFGQIDIFPNPNRGLFNLVIGKTEGKVEIEDIEIWDIEGRFIRKIPVNYTGIKYETTIDLLNIQSGFYLIKVKAQDEIGLRKFLIQR